MVALELSLLLLHHFHGGLYFGRYCRCCCHHRCRYRLFTQFIIHIQEYCWIEMQKDLNIKWKHCHTVGTISWVMVAVTKKPLTNGCYCNLIKLRCVSWTNPMECFSAWQFYAKITCAIFHWHQVNIFIAQNAFGISEIQSEKATWSNKNFSKWKCKRTTKTPSRPIKLWLFLIKFT